MIYAGSSGPSLLADPDREPFQYEIQQQALHHLMPGVQTTTEEKIQGTTQYHHLNKKAYFMLCSNCKDGSYVLDW